MLIKICTNDFSFIIFKNNGGIQLRRTGFLIKTRGCKLRNMKVGKQKQFCFSVAACSLTVDM